MGYFHVVFTLPHERGPLALQNKRVVYGLLFRAAARTLLEVATDPKHLGARIGCLMVLHTWGQNLMHHPHVHAIVTGRRFRHLQPAAAYPQTVPAGFTANEANVESRSSRLGKFSAASSGESSSTL